MSKLMTKQKKHRLNGRYRPYLYLIPSIIMLGIVFVYPVFSLLRMSLYDAHTLTGLKEFVGFANYRALWNTDFLGVLGKTAVWVGLSTPAAMAVGLLGALILNHDFCGKNVLKILAFAPWAIPHAMIAILWRWFIHPYYGMVNHLLLTLHLIDSPINFLSVSNAMFTAIGMRIWKGAPFAFITLLAALQTIPKELYEAAEVDGAGLMAKFRSITFPMIKGVFMATSLMLSIWAFVSFDMVWALTEGGPLRATEIVPITIYKSAFQLYNAGQSAAMSVVGLIIVGILGALYIRAGSSKE